MYQDYDYAVLKVQDYLVENNYCSTIVHTHMRCYRLFWEYLKELDIPYSRDLALLWLEIIGPDLCVSSFKNYRSALARMNDVLEHRDVINTKIAYDAVQHYQYLDKWCKDLLDEFLNVLSATYGVSFIQEVRISAARFLAYISKRGVCEVNDITHILIMEYYQQDRHKNMKVKDLYHSLTRHFLSYLSDKGLIMTSISFALNKFVLQRLVFIDMLSAKEKEIFWRINQQGCMTAEEFHSKAIILGSVYLDQHRYSSTMKKVFRKAWKELFVFLEANGLDYSQDIAIRWATLMQKFTVQWKTFRRAIKLFEQFRMDGDIQPAIVYSYIPDRVEQLPEWCQNEFKEFINCKRKEGLASSTIQMYRSSCLRFLNYITLKGITAWESLKPEIIKEFHFSDLHSTPEGRNAYASKIRGFLDYLADTGFAPSTLQLSLSSTSAARTDIIKTLNETDLSDLYEYRDQVQTGIQLRDATIILIGLRMGIRASDITKLKLSDILWGQKTISIQQKKTDKFLKLPMPTEVGNSLYRYIIHGRPESSSDYIFISHRVPYSGLERSICARALKKALTNDSHGFHITRKTFASRMLINKTKPDMIAEALGHSDNSTVMKYLSTDSETMRQCALSMEGIEVKGGLLL